MILSSVEAREARVLRERLAYGLCDLDAVEHWADPLIARMDEPPYGLLQLGLARTNGADTCSEAFANLELGPTSPTELLLALAGADVDALAFSGLEGLISSIWQRAVHFDGDASTQRDPANRVLMKACEPWDTFVHRDDAGGVVLIQKAVADYFRLVREEAVRLTVTS